jgi:hypothetical protein
MGKGSHLIGRKEPARADLCYCKDDRGHAVSRRMWWDTNFGTRQKPKEPGVGFRKAQMQGSDLSAMREKARLNSCHPN